MTAATAAGTPIRRLGPVFYGAAALLVLFPTLETVLAVFPFRPGEVAWRYGALGLWSRATMTPLIGLVLALAAATLLGHRRVLAFLAWGSLTLALFQIGASAAFVLDTVQMRPQVRPEAAAAFDVSAVVALVKILAAAALLLLVFVQGRRAGRSSKTDAPPRPRPAPVALPGAGG